MSPPTDDNSCKEKCEEAKRLVESMRRKHEELLVSMDPQMTDMRIAHKIQCEDFESRIDDSANELRAESEVANNRKDNCKRLQAEISSMSNTPAASSHREAPKTAPTAASRTRPVAPSARPTSQPPKAEFNRTNTVYSATGQQISNDRILGMNSPNADADDGIRKVVEIYKRNHRVCRQRRLYRENP